MLEELVILLSLALNISYLSNYTLQKKYIVMICGIPWLVKSLNQRKETMEYQI